MVTITMGLKVTKQNLDKEKKSLVSCWRNYTAAVTATPERNIAKKETPELLSAITLSFCR